MNFLISGGHGYGNVGDEAQLAGIISEIRSNFQNSNITVLSPNPKYTLDQHSCDKCILASREALFFQTCFPQLYNIRLKRNGSIFMKKHLLFKSCFWLLMACFLIEGNLIQSTRFTLYPKSVSNIIKNMTHAVKFCVL